MRAGRQPRAPKEAQAEGVGSGRDHLGESRSPVQVTN